MSRNASFWRKIAYLCGIAVLVLPLIMLAPPSAEDADGNTIAGGKLARLRAEHGLAQAKLGEVDPAGESIKLATLGMRGVAANLLWDRANHYKMTEDWDNLSATLKQITKLQPNFISVWEFQAHNLSYNVSVEFDDYRLRYHWVKKGIDFLIDGTRYNQREPKLFSTVGWFFGQKMGRADEHVQFRRLFRRDRDFIDGLREHVEVDQCRGANGYDNWLMGKLWFVRAVDLMNEAGGRMRGKSPLLANSDAAMSQINYVDAIQTEGIFGEYAQIAWEDAADGWAQFGRVLIPTSWGHDIRLGDMESQRDDAKAAVEELDRLAPGAREEIYQEKLAALPEAERQAVEMNEEDREARHWPLYFAAQPKLHVTHDEVAERAPEADRETARLLAAKASAIQELVEHIGRYRQIVNYEYWRTRCEVERTEEAVTARKLVYDAQQRLREGVLTTYVDENGVEQPGARQLFEMAWGKWAAIINEHAALRSDETADNLIDAIESYRTVLGQLDLQFPKDFPLTQLLKEHGIDPNTGEMLLTPEQASALNEDPTAITAETPPPSAAPDSAPQEDEQGDQ